MRTSKEWMREDTWHFEVEVLRIYGRQELWSHGFGARPVSDGPYQPVDAADVQRRVAFGLGRVKIMNSRSGTDCCVHRSRWPVVSGAPARDDQFSERARREAVRPQIEFSAVDLSPEKDLQHRLEVLALATDGEERPLAAPAPSLPLPAGGSRQQELLSRLEDAECARHRPLGLLSLELGLDSTPQ
ncbi:hypothetical protein THAOC_27159, partial [Thalassiosira oceanica]